MSRALSAASRLHGLAVRARAAGYDAGVLRTVRVPGLEVISIGGIAAGGDGKTPLSMYVAGVLRDRGGSVAIVSRGYRGTWERRGGVVSDGERVLASARQGGDEAVLCARRLPGVVVVVGADRVRAARRARGLGARVVVLDSGFQHRRLERDLDVVALDGSRLGEAMLPEGDLREPLSALARADLLAYHAPPPGTALPARGFAYRLVPTLLVDLDLNEVGPPTDLAGKRVLVVAGIARPERVTDAVAAMGARVVAIERWHDHQVVGLRVRERLARLARRSGAQLVVTTEKDAVRLMPLSGVEAVALRVEVQLGEGATVLEESLGRSL